MKAMSVLLTRPTPARGNAENVLQMGSPCPFFLWSPWVHPGSWELPGLARFCLHSSPGLHSDSPQPSTPALLSASPEPSLPSLLSAFSSPALPASCLPPPSLDLPASSLPPSTRPSRPPLCLLQPGPPGPLPPPSLALPASSLPPLNPALPASSLPPPARPSRPPLWMEHFTCCVSYFSQTAEMRPETPFL